MKNKIDPVGGNVPFKSSKMIKVSNTITLGRMTPEARDVLEIIIDEWEKQKKEIRKSNPTYRPTEYGFAYWLIRYSGLVQPTNKK